MKNRPKGTYPFANRLIALCVTAVMVVVCLTGCATGTAISEKADFGEIMAALRTDLFGSAAQDCRQLSLTLPVHAGFAPIEDKSAYDSLADETLRRAYLDIEESLFQISAETDGQTGYYLMKYTRLPSDMAFDDIYIVKEAVLCDHPEAFWVLGSYDIRNNFHDGNYLVLYSRYSYEEITAAFDEINRTTEDILAQIPDDADELHREMVIHDALVDSVSYDLEAAESDDSTSDAFTMYGAMVKKQAVCSGYAYAAKMLLNRVGIASRVVVGMSKNSGHMWNEVRIDGKWYHLDVTWDDSSADSDVMYNRYHYFNLNDEMIGRNHKIGKNIREMVCEYTDDGVYTTAELYNFDLEPADSLDANYYALYAASVTAMDKNGVAVITDKMKQASRNRQELVYIRFDESVSSESAEAWLATSEGGHYSALRQALADANNAREGSRIKYCTLARMWNDDSEEESVWKNLYAARLVYA